MVFYWGGEEHLHTVANLISTMQTLSREVMLGMLHTGSNGNHLLDILDAIVSNDYDVVDTQEQEVSA